MFNINKYIFNIIKYLFIYINLMYNNIKHQLNLYFEKASHV